MDMQAVIERLDSEIAITASSVFGIGIAEAVRQPPAEQPTNRIVGIRGSTGQDDAHIFGGTSHLSVQAENVPAQIAQSSMRSRMAARERHHVLASWAGSVAAASRLDQVSTSRSCLRLSMPGVCASACRSTLSVPVFGSSERNSMIRGYLYGRSFCFTYVCSRRVASSASNNVSFMTTKAFRAMRRSGSSHARTAHSRTNG